ncbi:unnamed protein product, partial [Staurois parvus]
LSPISPPPTSVLHPLSPILHPPTSVLHPLSPILHPLIPILSLYPILPIHPSHLISADDLSNVLPAWQPFCRKLLGRRWLSNSDACDGIVSGLAEYAVALRRLNPGPYQATVSELHRRVLLEYVR